MRNIVDCSVAAQWHGRGVGFRFFIRCLRAFSWLPEKGFEPSLTDPEGDGQPQKVQAVPPCSKSSTTLLCDCYPRPARRGTVTEGG
jgi:hypothetical protein